MRKKIFAILLILVCSSAFLISPVLAGEYYAYVKPVELVIGQIEAKIGGEVYKMEVAPYVKNGRTLVPLRFLGEALGAVVSWDGKKNTASLTLNDRTVKVTVGSRDANVSYSFDSEVYSHLLDVPAELKSGRVFVPLRFISEEFRATVDFAKKTNKVTVFVIDKSGWKEVDDSVLCPNDWVGEITKEEMYHYQSPNKSEVWVQFADENYLPETAYDFKQNALNNGFKLVEENYNLDLDASIIFVGVDSNGNIATKYVIRFEQREEGLIINEILYPIDVYEFEYPVVNAIIDQYHFPNWYYDQQSKRVYPFPPHIA